MAQRLLDAVEARRAAHDDPLLVNSRGERWQRTSLSEAFARIGKRAGLPVRTAAHIFRASFNVIARRIQGLDVQQRAALLNHVSTATIAAYDRLDSVEEEHEAGRGLWDAFNKIVDERNGK